MNCDPTELPPTAKAADYIYAYHLTALLTLTSQLEERLADIEGQIASDMKKRNLEYRGRGW